MDFDFTLKKYRNLLESLQEQTFSFLPFDKFILSKNNRTICLRHDVDSSPLNSLEFSRIQHDMGIQGTYYFRTVPESWEENVIKEISGLGHEVGYHYECLTTTNGDVKAAIKDFEKNLDKLRKLVPVKTICMHGSPRSKYDSKEMWKYNDYRDYGVIGEPYFDTDFSKVAYYTDTGRMWDGSRYSVRDKVSISRGGQNSKPEDTQFPTFHTTRQMIKAIHNGTYPQQAMLTFHPQRWTDKMVPWIKELVMQSAKNLVKRWFFVRR